MVAQKVEVAIPCLNEAPTIGKVVRDFRRVLPEAGVVVYDNGSTDGTQEIARTAGAEVQRVVRQGKGYVVQAVFESSRADIVLIVDGDDTYEAGDAPLLLEPLFRGDADMTIGVRVESSAGNAFRPLHRWGNRFITWIFNAIFRRSFRDILSGYRAFSRPFLENVPLVTSGFETETELTLQSLELGLVVVEVPVRFRNRPSGSASKLKTLSDGYRILITMVILLRDHRPFLVFGMSSGVLALLAVALWSTGRAFAWMVGVTALAIFLVGLILNTINTRFREVQSLLRRPRVGLREESPSETLSDSPCSR